MYTQNELDKILKDHQKWLLNNSKGKRADLSRANLSKANLSGANLSNANLSWADFSGADLSGADLSRANLSWANLSGANLSRADLSGAILSEANLSWVNLLDTKLNNTIVPVSGPIRSFKFDNFIANYYSNILHVGCLSHPIEYWEENYKQIGKDNNFTDLEIEMYGLFIDICLKEAE